MHKITQRISTSKKKDKFTIDYVDYVKKVRAELKEK